MPRHGGFTGSFSMNWASGLKMCKNPSQRVPWRVSCLLQSERALKRIARPGEAGGFSLLHAR